MTGGTAGARSWWRASSGKEELADRESWEQLETLLALLPGKDAAIGNIKSARREEEEHVVKVRNWIAAGTKSSTTS